jgi:hypothetical protein
MYGFGTQERSKLNKIYYNKDIAKLDCSGNCSPGPVYQTRDASKFVYYQVTPLPVSIIDIQQQGCKFDRAVRKVNPDAKYDHYHRKDIDVSSYSIYFSSLSL